MIQLLRSIKCDLFRYNRLKGISGFINAVAFIPGFRFILYFRIINFYGRKSFLLFPVKLFFKNLQVKYGFQIPHTCIIGKAPFFGHYGNIVINQHVKIGDFCSIAQGVTIGKVSRGAKKGFPIIGNKVWIGANSVIVGDIKVGDRVLIAPLAYVNFDVPNDAVVSGNPAKIINYKGSQDYINNIIP